jgi:glutamate dehydrogenase (NAD(P)+)
MTRRYTSEIGIIIGPNKDIPAPDVNTNEQTMAWMMDTYSMNVGSTATGVVTGKPVDLGGSLGQARGHGPWRLHGGGGGRAPSGAALAGARVAVQGFGNVGSVSAKLVCRGRRAHRGGARPQRHAVCRGRAWTYRLQRHVAAEHGGIAGFAHAQSIWQRAFWDVESDILIPAALEQQITECQRRPHSHAHGH